MRGITWILLLVASCTACIRQPTLSSTSRHNVTGLLNDSTWFATGKAIRLFKAGDQPNSVKQFDLQIVTDIAFLNNSSATKSPTVTGCIDDEKCVPTQRLHMYTIPLKRGKYKLAKLDKRRTAEFERTNYWLLVNGGGVYKNYQVANHMPNWIRVTKYNQLSGTIEGQFTLNLDVNKGIEAAAGRQDKIEYVARFSQGLFRVKLVDAKLK